MKRLRTGGVSSDAASSAAAALNSVLRPAGEDLRTFVASRANEVSQPWQAFSAYVSDPRASDEFQPVELKPGFGDSSASLSQVICALRSTLRANALRDSFVDEIAAVTAGTLLHSLPTRSRRRKKPQSFFLLDRLHLGWGKVSSARRLVWLAPLHVLDALVAKGGADF